MKNKFTLFFLILIFILPVNSFSQCMKMGLINQSLDNCEKRATYTITADPVPDKVKWIWHDNSSYESTSAPGFSVIKSYDSPGNYSVQAVLVYFGEDCNDTLKQNYTIVPRPDTRLEANGNPGFIAPDVFLECGSTYDMEAQISNPDNLADYQIRWDEGMALENIADPSTVLEHSYNAGIYELTIVGNTNDGCVDSTKYQVVCEKMPSFNLSRSPTSEECAPHTEEITLSPDYFPLVNYTWDWGDGNVINFSGKTQDTILYHDYEQSSKNKEFKIQENVICENCFGITVVATNPYCPGALSVQAVAPIIVFDKPQVDFNITPDSIKFDSTRNAFFTCVNDTFGFVNLSESGYGLLPGEDGYGIADTIKWSFFNEQGDLLDQQSFMCYDFHCRDTLNKSYPQSESLTIMLTQSNYCGSNSLSRRIEIGDPPAVDFEILEETYCYPATITLVNNSSTDITEFMWNFGDGEKDSTTLNPEHTYYDEGDYTVLLEINDLYCYNSLDTSFSLTEPCEDLRVPTAFIPDSPEEKFRKFKPVGDNLIHFSMEIYTLNGQLLWETHTLNAGRPADGWNGTYNGEACPPGTYLWKIEAVLNDGTPGGRQWPGENGNTTGTLLLIR